MTIRRVKRFLWSQMYLNGDFSSFIPIFKVLERFISKNKVKSDFFCTTVTTSNGPKPFSTQFMTMPCVFASFLRIIPVSISENNRHGHMTHETICMVANALKLQFFKFHIHPQDFWMNSKQNWPQNWIFVNGPWWLAAASKFFLRKFCSSNVCL